MEYDEFLSSVRRQIHTDPDTTERVIRATLVTLAERLSKGQARDIREQLPAELKSAMYTESDAEPLDLETFLRRVADRAETDEVLALPYARAVFWTLGEALTEKELRDLAAELPQEYRPLVAEAQHAAADVMPAEEYYRRVAERAHVDADTARRATDAVLETLAERIAPGEVDDLLGLLPAELHGPLHRAERERTAEARRMSRDEFLRRIAEREGVDAMVAADHARVEFATLREAVGDEFLDVRAQLPPEYADLLQPA
jgi:uncharacterized protein (DUF2267 family)